MPNAMHERVGSCAWRLEAKSARNVTVTSNRLSPKPLDDARIRKLRPLFDAPRLCGTCCSITIMEITDPTSGIPRIPAISEQCFKGSPYMPSFDSILLISRTPNLLSRGSQVQVLPGALFLRNSPIFDPKKIDSEPIRKK